MKTHISTTIRKLLCQLALVVIVVMVGGCKKSNRLPVYPARGQVLVNGKPAKGVFVYLWPASTQGVDAYCPNGQTDEKGEFILATYAPEDGAPAGDYKVTAEWPARFNIISNRWEGDKFKGRYADQNKSTVTVTISKGKNELEALKFEE